MRFLESTDRTDHFGCGEPTLDEWLRKRALKSHGQGAARCLVHDIDGAIAGYYALAATSVLHVGLPGRARRNMPEPVPAILLARLAVDLKFQERGLGAALLRDAILRTVAAAESIGVRLLVVHALNERAAAWYRGHDFEPFLNEPHELFMLIQDARSAMGLDSACHRPW